MSDRPIRVVTGAGARPNFMKIAPLMREFRSPARQGAFEPTLVHTGQHYDAQMSESFFEELDIPQQWERYQQDAEWRRDVAAAFNDKSERIVGRRLLHEPASEVPRPAFPAVKQLHEVFEMENRWDPISQSWWLHPSVSSSDELRALLDRVDGRLNDFRAFLLPQEWDDRRAGLLEAGARPPAYRGQRGPVTFATSMVGAQELVYLIADDPDRTSESALGREGIKNDRWE